MERKSKIPPVWSCTFPIWGCGGWDPADLYRRRRSSHRRRVGGDQGLRRRASYGSLFHGGQRSEISVWWSLWKCLWQRTKGSDAERKSGKDCSIRADGTSEIFNVRRSGKKTWNGTDFQPFQGIGSLRISSRQEFLFDYSKQDSIQGIGRVIYSRRRVWISAFL